MFVSYAQNFEDVMLWRALHHIGEGFYIDVGACDPARDSVTRAFYERGWRGVNIEPAKGYFQRLVSERRRDVNLRVAVGAAPGERTLYDILGTGLTTFDRHLADQHERSGHIVRPDLVRVMLLSDICAQYVQGTIHFMKIDVEGAEAGVLQGMDFTRFRPWVIVIEATVPTTQSKAYEAWEPMLLDGAYDFAYYDGLNRFYLARERGDLKQFFDSPPNCFDQFVKIDQAEAAARADTLKEVVTSLRVQLGEAKAEARRREELVAELRARLSEIGLARLKGIYRRRAVRLIRPLVRSGASIPLLRRAGRRLLVGQPMLKAKLIRLTGDGWSNEAQDDARSDPFANLPERARRIHSLLRGKLQERSDRD
ncbi:MAG TPA: FkbM family methyltransferase [bacterium]|nr:FkbM family methyltransferase [bacterium]